HCRDRRPSGHRVRRRQRPVPAAPTGVGVGCCRVGVHRRYTRCETDVDRHQLHIRYRRRGPCPQEIFAVSVLVSQTFTGTNGATPGNLIVGLNGTGTSVTIQSNRADFGTGTVGGYSPSSKVGRQIASNGGVALAVTDVDLTVTFYPSSGESYPEIILRGSQTAWDGQTGYVLTLSSGVFEIDKQVNYVSTTLASTAYTYVPGTAYFVRFKIIGTSLEAYIGTGSLPGTPTLTATDSSIASGNVYLSVNPGGGTTSAHVQ